jgi:hypothetical protein
MAKRKEQDRRRDILFLDGSAVPQDLYVANTIVLAGLTPERGSGKTFYLGMFTGGVGG